MNRSIPEVRKRRCRARFRYVMYASIWLLVGSAGALGSEKENASLVFNMEQNGNLTADFILQSEPPSASALEEAVSDALGFRLYQPPGGPTSKEPKYDDTVADPDETFYVLCGFCDGGDGGQHWFFERSIDLSRLLVLLDQIGVRWLTISVGHPARGPDHCSPESELSRLLDGYQYHTYRIPVGSVASFTKLVVAFGYRPADLGRMIAPMFLIPFLPIGLTLWMRRKVLASYAADPAAAWFRYFRFLSWTMFGIFIAWMAALSMLDLNNLARHVSREGSVVERVSLWLGLYFVPPYLVYLICVILSQQVYSRIRGMEWTRQDLTRQMIWGFAAIVVPLESLMIGVYGLLEGERTSVIWLVVAYASRLIFYRLSMRAQNLTREALTVGELRDRVFALAKVARVSLKQVYVLPRGKGRLMNAFATSGNEVMFSDHLVEQLSKREVDAIVAHELSHLKHRHPSTRIVVLLVSFFILTSAAAVLNEFNDRLPLFAFGWGCSSLAFLYFSRQFEYAADAGALALTGDPEALITALTRLTRLNLMPLQWGRLDAQVITHPSTLRRAQAIARRVGMPQEYLQKILDTSPADSDRYLLPRDVTAEEKLFSTSFKSSAAARYTWALLAVTALTPALAAWIVAHGHWTITVNLAIYLAGAIATITMFAVVTNLMPVSGSDKLQRRFRGKLQRQGIEPEELRGVFVALSPAPYPRVYEANYDWDIGYLFLSRDRLCYVGEQARFALQRSQVTSVRLGEGPPAWWRSQRIYISWIDSRNGARETFSIRPNNPQSLRRLQRDVLALGQSLEGWLEGRSEPVQTAPFFVDLKPPVIGSVTCIRPREFVEAGRVFSSLCLFVIVAAAVSVLFGLSFNPLRGGSAWYVIVIATLCGVVQMVPYWRYREPDQSSDLAV